MQTPEGFRSLASLLRPAECAPVVPREPVPVEEERIAAECDAARDVRLFRARMAEALDEAVEIVCRDIACEVVARELELKPADIAAVVANASQRFAAESVSRIRVHPDDAAAVRGVGVRADASLRRGDAVLEVSAGTIDASLGVRLASVLRSLQ